MNRRLNATDTTVCRFAASALLALLAAVTGCGPRASQTPPTAPVAADGPHQVTNLSSISSGDALGKFDKGPLFADAAPDQASRSLRITTGVSPGIIKRIGTDSNPGEEKILNNKAAQFNVMSMRLMDNVFEAMSTLENGYDISHLKVPLDLKPVIIIATMNRRGKLKDILIEQHSGQGVIDNMVVKACKTALWYPNPPADAQAGVGYYQVRLEARVENYVSMDGDIWDFKTYLGIAIL